MSKFRGWSDPRNLIPAKYNPLKVLLVGQPLESTVVGNDSFETKDNFSYLGDDMISAGGGAEESCIVRNRCGWKKF